MRLQRYLAASGVASRRRSEELIVAGLVRVNGASCASWDVGCRRRRRRVQRADRRAGARTSLHRDEQAAGRRDDDARSRRPAHVADVLRGGMRCGASFRSAGSITIPPACCCSPTTVHSRTCSRIRVSASRRPIARRARPAHPRASRASCSTASSSMTARAAARATARRRDAPRHLERRRDDPRRPQPSGAAHVRGTRSAGDRLDATALRPDCRSATFAPGEVREATAREISALRALAASARPKDRVSRARRARCDHRRTRRAPSVVARRHRTDVARDGRAERIDPADVASALFTLTPDLVSEFPAAAARRMGWTRVPLLNFTEVGVPGGLPRVHSRDAAFQHREASGRDRPRLPRRRARAASGSRRS